MLLKNPVNFITKIISRLRFVIKKPKIVRVVHKYFVGLAAHTVFDTICALLKSVNCIFDQQLAHLQHYLDFI